MFVRYDLVIFDMDGTLIDSETMAEQIIAETSQMLHRPVTPEESSELFRAKVLSEVFAILEAMQPEPLPQAFFDQLSNDYVQAVHDRLQPSAGARDAIEAIVQSTPVCLASNGEPETIELCMRSVGFDEFFEGRWFSAKDVANPKPAPDLFLHAADIMGAKPTRCVVVEDSVLGVTGGLAAGMDVIGYCGNSPEHRAHLEALGVPVIDDLNDLPAMVLGD